MTENEILVLHDTLYAYLNALHEVDEAFMFRVRQKSRDKRLEKGYWFNGNDKYLETSFWDYKDKSHTTPVIRIVYFFETRKWACELIARDMPERAEYFEKMASFLFGFSKDNKQNIWRSSLLDTEDFLDTLHHFIKDEKRNIDFYIKNNEVDKIVTFIKTKKFQEDVRKIENLRNQAISDEIFQKILFFKQDFSLFLKNKAGDLPAFFCALSRIYIANFQGIKQLTIDDIPINTQWIFLTGENSFGKTSILRAIAKGLVGDEDLVQPFPIESTIYTNGYNFGESFYYEAKPKKVTYNDFKVATYGVSRFQVTSKDGEVSERAKQDTYSLFHVDGLMINIERVLIDTERDDVPTFSKLKEILKKILPNLAEIKSELIDKKRQIRYYEKNETGESYGSVSLNELGAGYRGILTMIGDMVIRLSSNLDIPIDELQGIVLIDEIDAHLHPKYQYELPRLLSEVFPKVQFIVTTHSPIPLLSLPKTVKSIVLTVDRTPEDGITVDRKDDDFDMRKLSAEALLTSPIFNFQTLFARDAKENGMIPTSDFKEVMELEELKNRLKKLREQGFVQ